MANAVYDNDGVLSINGLYSSVVAISLIEESTLSVVLHKGSELVEMLLLNGPHFSEHVEENGLGARRSGQ